MELMSRMGFEAEAHRIQELFFEGKRDEAIPLVPTEFADEISLVGSKERIRDRLQAWEASPVTTIIMNGDLDTLRAMAELVGLDAGSSCRARSGVADELRAGRRSTAAGGPSAACEKSSSAATTRSRSSGDMRRTTCVDLAAALLHHFVDEALAEGRELDHDFAPVERRRLARDEPAATRAGCTSASSSTRARRDARRASSRSAGLAATPRPACGVAGA